MFVKSLPLKSLVSEMDYIMQNPFLRLNWILIMHQNMMKN